MKFECHITMSRSDGPAALNVSAEYSHLEGGLWKYSQIDGDPVMGQQVFCYLTRYDTSYVRLYSAMKTLVAALPQNGVNVLRQKIELIMYDTKTGVGQ
jgi:hypothetical protein